MVQHGRPALERGDSGHPTGATLGNRPEKVPSAREAKEENL